jgi:hypothetical protein
MKRVDLGNAVNEYTKVFTFQKGLNPKYRFHICTNNLATLETAVKIARVYELSYGELAQQSVGIVQNSANKTMVTLLSEVQSQLEAL